MMIRCTAVGGNPPPNVIIQIGINGPDYTGTGGVKEHTISAIDRSFDGTPVLCKTDYPGVEYQPLIDTGFIYLNLKPLPPSFNPDPISTEATKLLVLTCTSTGSRPLPADRLWLLGDSNTDITSRSTEVSQSSDPSKPDTYISTSTLTYTVHKQHNGKKITCGFKNIATGNNFVKSSVQIDVKYAPEITVQNISFEQNEWIRKVQCILDGNPNSYTFKPWEHRSKYGYHIRYLSAGHTITLPSLSEDSRYQDTGEYVCTANNGIVSSMDQLDQKGSGFITSKAKPIFLNGNYQAKLGQKNKDVKIDVSVYSEPQYTSFTWYKDGSQISQSSKYELYGAFDIFNVTFHGVNILADGYRLILTIRSLQGNDFTNYTLIVSNGVGDPVDHVVTLKSVESPDSPTQFNVTDIRTSSISVQWKPGFDGGSEQSFVIQFRMIGANLWTSRKIDNNLASYKGGSFVFTLNDLDMGTFYALRMYAQNIFSSSSYTNVLEISTKHTETQNVPQLAIAGVAGGLSTVILILLGVIGVLLWRLNTCKRANSHHKRNDTDTTQHYMDVSDDHDDSSSKSPSLQEGNITSPVSEYEELGMRDQPNVYSQVYNAQQQKDETNNFYSNQQL